MAASMADAGTLQNDHTSCGICLHENFEPITKFPHCSHGHDFCLSCISKLRCYAGCKDGKFNCPVCRAPIPLGYKLEVDETLKAARQIAKPSEFLAFTKEQKAKMKTKTRNLLLLYGNKHLVDPNLKRCKHQWTAYVKIVDENTGNEIDPELVIEKVYFNFQKYYRPVTIKAGRKPLAVTKWGWGYFDMFFKVTFKSFVGIRTMKLEHELSFDGDGNCSGFPFQIKKSIKKRSTKRSKNTETNTTNLTVEERRARGTLNKQKLRNLPIRSYLT